ncbi:MAG: class I SAM-dependent methyltransferase, partial [Bacilli bacterium]|nr:class I SAM-dependent methyltransferase [Bacilli bacterium]
MISSRLKSLIKYVECKDKIIDIGCDHALLDIYLVKNKVVDSLIVSDVHEGAINAGIANIKKNRLSQKIDARLGNGLEVLRAEDDINTILISGMGTSTILNILHDPYLDKIEKLILQSNNDHFELRSKVISLGFYIEAEEYFVDNKKNY